MDLLGLAQQNQGIAVGGAWAFYEIARYVSQSRRNSAQQVTVDKGTNALIQAQQKAIDEANTRARQEQERADRLMVENMTLHSELGATRSDRAHEIDNRTRAEARVNELQGTVEALVLENRNKDRSISSLTDFNKQLLQLMKPGTDAPEPAPSTLES